MDIQTLIVILLVIFAVLYLARKYARSAKGKGGCGCGCDCGGSCPDSGKPGPESTKR